MKHAKCLGLGIGILLFAQLGHSQTKAMALIDGGSYTPIYGRSDSSEVQVASFELDVYPVSMEDYLVFLQSNPKWLKSNRKEIFADGNYLRRWQNDSTWGLDTRPNAPVVNVSWFAATDYCRAQGKRLPTLDEWEYVAMANTSQADARENEDYNKFILSWYETPKTYNNPIGQTFKNFWGVYDLHGLVWEWIADFNSVLMSGESRKDSNNDPNLFCGSASLGASDLMDYAAFMRYAFRGSIKANYCVQNLGFRCAKDLPIETP